MDFSPSSLKPRCKILVIKLRSIGDVVLNTPVLENIKANLPRCGLSVLVETPSETVLQGNRFVDEVIIRDKDRSSLFSDLRLLLEIRRRRFDLILDFHGGPRAANIAFLSGARFRMGHKNSPRAWAYNLRVTTKYTKKGVHTVKEQLAKLNSLGMKTEEVIPQITVSDNEKEAARNMLSELGIGKDEPFAVIHPGVIKSHQRWQPDKMARIADHIQAKFGIRVVFVSLKGQISQVMEITDLMITEALSLAGKTSLRQLISLLSEARFLVCHNGGQMHLAAAVGTRVFALFGPSTPDVFGPVGAGHRVFYKRLDCSPCAPNPKYDECKEGRPICLAEIGAEEIIQAIEESIETE